MCLGTQQIQAVRSTRFYSWSPLPAQLAARNSRVCAITGAACAPHTEDRKPPHLLSTTLLSRHRSGRGGAETTSTRGHRRSPSSLATPPPPPPAQLLRAKPSRLEGGAPVPALRRGRAASRGRRASRSAPIRTVRAHGGAPGLGVGRRAYGCCALILASAASANLGCPCFPEPYSSPPPGDISATARLD